MFGVEESENTYFELENIIVNIINMFFEFPCDKNNIELVRRLGKKGDNIRPVVITFNSMSYKLHILKNKSCLENTQYYIKEDYPIEVLNRRKELQVQLQKEKEKGYTAFIRYDKLIVLKGTFEKENPTKKVLETRKQLQPKTEEEWKKGNKYFLKGDQLIVFDLRHLKKLTNTREQPIKTKTTTTKSGKAKQIWKKHILKQPNQEAFPPRLVAAGRSDHHPLTKKHNIYIASLNTRTLRTPESLSELEVALKDLKWDVLGLSEVRRPGNSIEEHEDYIMFHKGEIGGQRGVGFLVKTHLKNSIEDFIGMTERIAILHLKIPSFKKIWSIIQVYAPTEQADELEHTSFYNTLSQIIYDYSNNIIILMGDFNAQVGARQNDDEYILGEFAYGKRSINGQRLIDLLLEHNLTIANSIFKKNKNNKWTWVSPDGKYRNEIDYIISSHPKLFTDTTVISRLNFNTNHRMVRASLKIAPPKIRRKHINLSSRTHIAETNETTSYPLATQTRVTEETEELDIRNKCTRLQNQLRYANTRKEKKQKYILSDSTMQLINKRKSLIANKNGIRNLREIAEISKGIRKSIRRDRKTRRIQTLEKHIIESGGTKKALKELREATPWVPNLKRNQINITNRKTIVKTASDFYKNLYSNPAIAGNEQCNNYKTTIYPSNLEPDILQSEVRKAILSQKSDKAPGPDKITNGLLKGTLKELVPILTKIFNDILTSEQIPEQWQTSHIILIYKKGSKEDLSNYRPISLMSNIYKVFSKILLDRLSTTLDESQPMEQAGFRKNFATIDHIHTVKQIIEKYSEYNKTVYMAFIDYTKAFDSIKHEVIWESLENQGVSGAYINIIKQIYANCNARIQMETLGKTFKIERGVRQGDPLSPKLFSAVLENIFRKLEWNEFGLNIDGRKLHLLRFADDIVLFEENPHKLGEMIQDLNKESEKVGLKMNTSKTKLLSNSVPYEIKLNNQPLEYVEEYIYLGQIISLTDITTWIMDGIDIGH
ncbi:unnamed protein product [Pieris macdunnoughi]|uniref:Reverse transcriptase domain-containing protein n=1 Tax=Pieris macdunnoughi TaxID=345717 RepID=A0A821L1W8_9NEOP|nr:unnamed protein product [Pieris macdunnoughi]